MSALNAVKYGYSLEDSILGDYELAHTLKKNQGFDLGLAKIYPYITELKDLVDLKQFKALEERVDSLLISFVNDSLQSIFNADAIYAYFIKLAIAGRWLILNEEEGMSALNKIIGNVLQTGVWPEDFSQRDLYVMGED